MKNNIILLILILSLLLISGQKGCKRKAEFNATALEIKWVENAPPAELAANAVYPVMVDIKNKGGSDIEQGQAHFYLEGVGENLKPISLALVNKNFLPKTSPERPGGTERLVFAEEAAARDVGFEFEFPISLVACYRYSTLARTEICVGKNEKICSITGNKIKSTDNSAGPVQVTELTETISGNRLLIKARIENKGKGKVYLSNLNCDALQAGGTQAFNEQAKTDKVEIAVQTDPGFSCSLYSFEGQPITALEGVTEIGLVSCEKDLGTETYTAPFSIRLAYFYRETFPRTLKIVP